jgi:hypothetical protein
MERCSSTTEPVPPQTGMRKSFWKRPVPVSGIAYGLVRTMKVRTGGGRVGLPSMHLGCARISGFLDLGEMFRPMGPIHAPPGEFPIGIEYAAGYRRLKVYLFI